MKAFFIIIGIILGLFTCYYVSINLLVNAVYNFQHNKKVLRLIAEDKSYRAYLVAFFTPGKHSEVVLNFAKMLESQFDFEAYEEIEKEV